MHHDDSFLDDTSGWIHYIEELDFLPHRYIPGIAVRSDLTVCVHVLCSKPEADCWFSLGNPRYPPPSSL